LFKRRLECSYQRDIRERLLNSDKYYAKKRSRDSAFRNRKCKGVKKAEPVVTPSCEECGKAVDNHFVWCSKRTGTGLETLIQSTSV